jgi:hypothetical protein
VLIGKAEVVKGAEFRRLKVGIEKLSGWRLDCYLPDSMIVFRPAKATTIGRI